MIVISQFSVQTEDCIKLVRFNTTDRCLPLFSDCQIDREKQQRIRRTSWWTRDDRFTRDWSVFDLD